MCRHSQGDRYNDIQIEFANIPDTLHSGYFDISHLARRSCERKNSSVTKTLREHVLEREDALINPP